jgi:phosphatidylglycerophosphate synthase
LLFGVVVEAIALALSFGLYSLKHGREPMEPPFNWTATVIQMPGIILADSVGWRVGYSAWCQWSIIFVAQALLWTTVGFFFHFWRSRETK